MRIPTEIVIDGVTYHTRWMVTGQGSFVERLEILVSKVIYVTLEKCTEDVSNKYKDEIRHLLAKNLALFLNNYADVLFNKGQEFIPDKLFINGQMFDTRYTNHFGSHEGKMGPFAILVAVIRTILDGQFENVSFASKSVIGRSITLALCDFFEKNKESLFNGSASSPEKVFSPTIEDAVPLSERLKKFASVAYLLPLYRVQDNKNSEPVPMAPQSPSAQKLLPESMEALVLITSMVLSNASKEEVDRAANYAVSVIAVEKSTIDCVEAKRANGIDELMKKYYPT